MSTVWGEITAHEILAPIGGTWISGNQQTILKGLSTDSRKTVPGDLFWALKGERYDGHDFIEMAIDRGAAGVVIQEGYLKGEGGRGPVIITVDDTLRALGDLAAWWRQHHTIQLLAITGSAGKTTTKEMAACILKLGHKTLKNQGNYNNLIGLPLTLMQLDESYQRAVLEMGMNHPGEIARLTCIADPDVGMITNVGMAHTEGLGSLEGVARAKVELVEKLSSKGTMILNGDDELLLRTASEFRKDALLFGIGKKNDVRARKIKNLGVRGSSFLLQYQDSSWPMKISIPGIQNVLNGLAAAAACLCLNEPPEHIAEGLARYLGMKGRFMVMPLTGGVTLVDDTYNSNPLSLKAALDSMGAFIGERSRIIVGLGEMMELGDAAVSAHREAGQMVSNLGASHFFAIGEHTNEMIKGAVVAGMSLKQTEAVKTHKEMAKRIRELMREGDIIFLKGSRKMTLEKVVEDLKDHIVTRGEMT